MDGIARIPVVPLSYGAASDLLEGLAGPGAPNEWQGALPFFYRTGPGPVRARLDVDVERGAEALHPIFNTIAVLKGSELPGEWVIIGAHRDAWGPGARDNVSGTTTVLAAAAAFARAARAGMRPRRSIVFATWDAEEWGLIGSTEWVEAHAEQVEEAAVAYLNQDSPVGGATFGASATPELKMLVRNAAAAVSSPDGPGSVLEHWIERSRKEELNQQPRVGDLGGGSDHVPFVQGLGIPGAGFGFSGKWGVYHSAYDAADWMERFGDPGYRRHAAAASVLAVMASRLANAAILPYDFPGLAADLQKRVDEIGAELRRSEDVLEDLPGLEGEIEKLTTDIMQLGVEAALLDSASVAALEAGVEPEALRTANGHLRRAAMAFTSGEGLPGAPTLRQLLYATDPDDGYATLALPSLRLAMRGNDHAELDRRLAELRGRVLAATEQLRDSRTAMTGLAADR
jgi:N-acetylated-alpha-linked acidic dipeptidase